MRMLAPFELLQSYSLSCFEGQSAKWTAFGGKVSARLAC